MLSAVRQKLYWFVCLLAVVLAFVLASPVFAGHCPISGGCG